MAARRILQVSARAFVSPTAEGGGNPVTIFYPPSTGEFTASIRSKLAQTCDWESVVVEPCQSDSSVSQLSFFMPSGEEVSFCAHAAIGACSFLANKTSLLSSSIDGNSMQQPSESNDHEQTITFFAAQERQTKYNAIVRGSEAELFMECEHYESECKDRGSSLSDFLNEIGLNEDDIDTDTVSTFLNSSVARSKTLIPVKSAERLHAATAPKDATKFQQMCESIDSTGLYLYDSSSTINNIECRQFPKSSGYAEDPATGIAAGALVASLHRHNDIGGLSATILQGTAMRRPSQIKVKIDKYEPSTSDDPSHRGSVNMSYAGVVQFDDALYLNEDELLD